MYRYIHYVYIYIYIYKWVHRDVEVVEETDDVGGLDRRGDLGEALKIRIIYIYIYIHTHTYTYSNSYHCCNSY